MKEEEMKAGCEELEMAYGVHIDEDALSFAAQLLQAYGNESPLLKDMNVMQLMERACRRLRENLDSESEEHALDWDEDNLDRAVIEVTELRKERTLVSWSIVLPRVEKELAHLMNKWECFTNKWAPIVGRLRQESENRIVLLRYLHEQMVSPINQGCIEVEHIKQLLPLLSTATTQLKHTIHSAFEERHFVGPSVIAQVASSITDLPVTFFHCPFTVKPTPQDLESKLLEKFFRLDNVIHQIASALYSNQQKSSTTGLFGSFLFLGPHGCDRTKLAKALAKEIFGDEERFTKLDMSEYKEETDYVSHLLVVLNRLEKKNGSIVMFDNIENGPGCIDEVLCQILREGRLTNGQGMCVSFSHDIVLVSSYVGCRKELPKLPPLDEIIKEPADLSYNGCSFRPFLGQVTNQFKPELFNLFDDVVLFPQLSTPDHLVISRLQIRDVATSMSTLLKKQVILYPSNAAVHNILGYGNFSHKGVHAYESWHKAYMAPLLSDVVKEEEEDDDRIIIYIDVLMGLWKEFSFRVEKSSSKHLKKYPPFPKNFKENLLKLRTSYRGEKQQVNKIYKLLTSCSHLFELLHSKADEIDTARVHLEYQEVVRLIHDLLMEEESSHDSNEPESEPVQLDDNGGELERGRKRRRRRAEPESFSLCKCKDSHDQNLLLIDAVKQRPHPSVIVFYELEMAHISVFSSILSILDSGVFEDNHGNIIDFRNSVVVIVSDLGDKEMIARLNGHNPEEKKKIIQKSLLTTADGKKGVKREKGSRSEKKIIQKPLPDGKKGVKKKGLRSELLNQLEHLLAFDPLSDDQLNQFANFPMKSLKEEQYCSFFLTFFYLFHVRGPKKVRYNAANMVRSLMKARRNARVLPPTVDVL
ncbi:hypothetical protein BUALT_Bualt18G0005000 [Buddleja alternifolia]|uniref:ATPase AAA-type core domain-containing protein n=1 Tax=Buddleja alternifolia TaxID=168488 RepID=A0AAV6W2M1_9LAMI|nr:hypothetical protein BUALT_Bualt18G0005000 [Buddleja alternifolia]